MDIWDSYASLLALGPIIWVRNLNPKTFMDFNHLEKGNPYDVL